METGEHYLLPVGYPAFQGKACLPWRISQSHEEPHSREKLLRYTGQVVMAAVRLGLVGCENL